MALIRYKVLRADVRSAEVSLPEKAIPLCILPSPDPVTALPVLAFLMTYSDWAEEFPDEAMREKIAEAGAPDA